MHTEHLHRTLSPQAYAQLQDHLRHQAEIQRHLAVQTAFLGWPSQLLQRARRVLQSISHQRALNA